MAAAMAGWSPLMFGRKKTTPVAGLAEALATTTPNARPGTAARPAATVVAPLQDAGGAPQVVRFEYYPAMRQAVFGGIDVSATLTRPREQVRRDIESIVSEFVERERLRITQAEQTQAVTEILNDMFG